ncbi:cysteinyl-tRNA synthetase [Didymosphaeria variabile]|uniref:cysteine--tRNA ligase n=1 Tax=Didymosphaeria variabile TaxID=1932322 RepID=A0A9W8XBF4_9PLEO|nr:cysteinyl-tRNA synthetase [Didymosphaeria variabile]KAJ4346405.1 cysteinyl-tRNA synthetase [Didymosphaeria variabile]
MASTSRQQPSWAEPHSGSPSKLSLYNSLVRAKTPFRPVDPEGKSVTWYSCGPTVYDDAHLGHARNYTSNDILRRIMNDYFGFDVQFVQNITDIDDKIILRGRQAHLLSNFQSEHAQITDDVLATTSKAFDAYIKKNLPLLNPGLKPEDFKKESAEKYAAVLKGKSVDGTGPPGDKEAKIKMHLKTAGNAVTALLSPSRSSNEDIAKFWEGAEDVLLPYLDSLHGTSISSSDHGIFTALTKKYEDRFNADMEALNVLPPNVVTRVSEYVPQIVAFTERIVSNGFAYQAGDGVYFDIAAFEKVKNNHYARLEPWEPDEHRLTGRRDFSLWKTSKPGEPAWDSPWGPGRPGWHIECSVMASEALGSQIDIHSGGIDLCFPHHDNELAQSEAYWSTEGGHQWINYFLHMGHLSIAGSKMSKSLKNFTTIREALARGDWTSRSLRIIFLLGGWHDGIEITDDMKKAGSSFESYVTNFFLRIKDLKIHPNTTSTGTEDAKIKAALESAKSKVHEALADSFDTPAAIRAIRGLIEDWNTADKAGLSDDVSRDLGVFVTRILRIFGLDGKADPNDGGIGWSGIDIPEVSKEFVYAASRLRDEVRQRAIAKDDLSEETLNSVISKDKPSKQQDAAAEDLLRLSQQKSEAKDFLELSDRLRDVHLWKAGVYLEDRTNAPAMVRPVDAELRAEREQKEAIARKKAEAKQQREREEAEKKAKLAAQAKISPKDMFKTEEYSAWDDDGVPTKDKEGADVLKSKAKKLRKEWEKQKKLHDEHLKGVGSS